MNCDPPPAPLVTDDARRWRQLSAWSLMTAAALQRRLDVVQRVSAAVHSTDTLEAMLERLLHEVLAAVGAQRGAAMIADGQRRAIRLRVAIGYPPGDLTAITRPLFLDAHPEEDIYAAVVRTGRQLVIGSDHPARNRSNAIGLSPGFRVLTPIGMAGETIGVFSAVWTQRQSADEDTLSLLRLVAEQAGGAVARARLSEAERLARDRLATALRNSGTVVYTYDADGKISHLDGDTEALVGWPADALVGKDVRNLPTSFADGARRPGARLGGGSVQRAEGRLRHRDGHDVFVVATEGPLVGEGAGGGGGAVTDMSALHRLLEERAAMEALRARAEGAVRTGRAIAHELATPLGVILGLAELLAEDRRVPSDLGADLRAIAAQAEIMGRLLQRFGRISSYEEVATPVGPQLDVTRASPVEQGA